MTPKPPRRTPAQPRHATRAATSSATTAATTAALLAGLLAGSALAAPDTATLRDPMQPPARRAAVGTPAAPAAAPLPLPVVRQILIVGEERYVVDQGRRRKVGDQLAGLRIERIEDAAVVVRDGAVLRRLPLFAGVAKQDSAEPTAAERPAR